jgi:hypothetical protein
MITLKNHPVWQDLSEIVTNLNTDLLIQEHLQLSDYKISGYWDDNDNFYSEISLPDNLSSQLINSSITLNHTNQRYIQLTFALNVGTDEKIGEVTLIYDENLEFIDEKWQLDLNSPSIQSFVNTILVS